MSLARKCDRCGKFYETYAGQDANDFGFNSVTLKDVDNGGDYCVRKHFDLCKECSAKLEEWLKMNAYIAKTLL